MDRAGAADRYLSAVDEGLKKPARRPDTTAARRLSTAKSRLPPPPLLPLPLALPLDPLVPLLPLPLGSLLTEGSLPEEAVLPDDPEPLAADTACTHEAVFAVAAIDVKLHAEN